MAAMLISHTRQLRKVMALFFVWKLMLLLLAAASPGPGYDTSTQILLSSIPESEPFASRASAHVLSKLVRWDALYFVHIANRDYVYEQEWAFGWGFTRLLSHVSKAAPSVPPLPPLLAEALVGARVAHFFHLLGALVLYALTLRVVPGDHNRRLSVAFTAACLHVLSPAGLFLSAPFSESCFAFLNFLGMVFCTYAPSSTSSLQNTLACGFCTLVAGACFGLASTVRGNGIFSGLVFVEPALTQVRRLLRNPLNMHALLTLVFIAIAGLFTAGGLAYPQYVAYKSYCYNDSVVPHRQWCNHLLPSIYTWVQQHYWNNGFLKYWTFSNLPLFLITLPMISLLLYTGIFAFAKYDTLKSEQSAVDSKGSATATVDVETERSRSNCAFAMRRFALTQLVFVVVGFTTFHVQILNRISSGYPVWYIVLALLINDTTDSTQKTQRKALGYTESILRKVILPQWLVRGMIMYAMVQGGLFASFLPPA